MDPQHSSTSGASGSDMSTSQDAPDFPRTLHDLLCTLDEQILRRERHVATVYRGRRRNFIDLDLQSGRLADSLCAPPDFAAPSDVAACTAAKDDAVLACVASLRVSACYTPVSASSSPNVLSSIMEEMPPSCTVVDSRTAGRFPGGFLGNQRMVNIEEAIRNTRENRTASPRTPQRRSRTQSMMRHPLTRPLLQILSDDADGRCSLGIERCMSRHNWEWNEWPAANDEVVAVLDDVDSARFWEDVLSALCSGSTAALAAEEEKRSPNALLKFLKDTSATRLEITPDRLRALLKRVSLARGASLPKLRLVKCSRGLVTTQLVHLFYRVLPHCRLAYVYEHAGHSCVYKCPAEIGELRHHSIANGDFVVLGKPVGDCRAFVRNANLAECPKGVTGSICLSSIDSNRKIVTGDTGFVNSDGNLVLASRPAPRIYGQKVDMTLISKCLKDVPGMTDFLLCWERIAEGDAALVAFYWSEAGGDRSGELFHRLATKLPAHWLPRPFPLGPPPKDRRPDAHALLTEYAAAVGKLSSCGEPNVQRGAPVLVALAHSLKVPVAQIDMNASYSRQKAGRGAASASQASALLDHIGYEISAANLESSLPVSKLVERAACTLVLPGLRRMRVSRLDGKASFPDVANLLARSYTTNDQLYMTACKAQDQHSTRLRHLWPLIVANAASQLVHDQSGRLVAVDICCNFSTELTLPKALQESFLAIMEINRSMERPLHEATQARGHRMLFSCMMGTAFKNEQSDNAALVQLMMANILLDAKKLGYAGVVSIISHTVPKTVSQQWFDFNVFDEAQVADFNYRGRRPFASIQPGTLITSVFKLLESPST